MKRTDATVLSAFRTDGRVQLTELSRRTGLPVSTLHERLKRYVEQGILKPIALLNFKKVGYDARAHILLSVDPASKDKLHAVLANHPNVNSLYRINNGWHFLLESVFPTMYELELFVEKIEQQFPIKRKEVHYTLDELKRETFLDGSGLNLLEATFK